MKIQIILSFALSVILSSCSSGGGSGAAATPNQSSATRSTLRSGIASLAIGVYSGDCITAETTDPMSGSITILSSGALQAPNVSTNLNNADVSLGYVRNFDSAGAPTDATFNGFTSGANAFALSLVSATSQSDNSAGVTMWAGTPGPNTTLNGIRCYNSPQTTSLKAANATTFAIPYIQSPVRTLTCDTGNSNSQVSYSVTNSQIRFGTDTFILTNGLSAETVTVAGDTGTFGYVADFLDGREVAISLDQAGTFLGVSVTEAGSSDPTNCVP